MYGGTAFSSLKEGLLTGLSPRVRGNLFRLSLFANSIRSIPACTGEPGGPIITPGSTQVYPRVYGGTSGSESARVRGQGLSPRVRGNLFLSQRVLMRDRSIPACTGEPRLLCCPSLATQVYPRVYGGTLLFYPTRSRGMGLSPRVRGNRVIAVRLQPSRRSIPACTGEPLRLRSASI